MCNYNMSELEYLQAKFDVITCDDGKTFVYYDLKIMPNIPEGFSGNFEEALNIDDMVAFEVCISKYATSVSETGRGNLLSEDPADMMRRHLSRNSRNLY